MAEKSASGLRFGGRRERARRLTGRLWGTSCESLSGADVGLAENDITMAERFVLGGLQGDFEAEFDGE
jgi:hypothetical protein